MLVDPAGGTPVVLRLQVAQHAAALAVHGRSGRLLATRAETALSNVKQKCLYPDRLPIRVSADDDLERFASTFKRLKRFELGRSWGGTAYLYARLLDVVAELRNGGVVDREVLSTADLSLCATLSHTKRAGEGAVP